MARFATKENLKTIVNALRDEMPDASSSEPISDGTASAGTSEDYARADHVHPTDETRASTDVATTSTNGLMSASDKTKLDGIESGANAYELPLMSPTTRGGAKLGHGLAIEDGALGIGAVTDPTDAGPIVELTAKGWAEQDTTVGKNLLPNTATSQTIDGVTFTVNADGSVTVNGTVSSGVSSVSLQICLATTYAAGTYTLSGCPEGGSGPTYRIDARNGTSVIDYDNGTNATFSLSEATDVNFSIRIGSGYTANNLTFYPQLEAGSEATEYEPYSGGAPSPSPSYPQEIRRVTGRNLFDESLLLRISGWTVSNGVYSGNTQNVNGTFGNGFPTPPFDSGQYVASFDLTSADTSKNSLAFVWNYTDGTTERITCKNSTQYTLVSDASKTVSGIALSHNSNVDISLKEFQVEKGNTPTPYVPYGYIGVDVQGRNLLNYDAWKGIIVARGTAVWDNNGVTLTATANDCYTEFSNANFNKNTRVQVSEGQTITLSWAADTDADGGIFIFPNGSTAGLVSANNSTAKSLTYTAGAGVTFVTFRFGVSAAGTTIRYSNIQIELGSTATTYEPYANYSIPIPLPSRGWVAALPDGTADTLTLDGAGGYVWELATDEVVLDGSETWTLGNNGARCGTTVADIVIAKNASEVVNGYADRFIAGSPNNTYVGGKAVTNDIGQCFSHNVNTPQLWFSDGTGAMTMADWKTWLTSNPVTVLYPLASPTTEQGYVDMPTVPIHATISTDLHDLTVRCCADEGAAEIASAWAERTDAELGDAIVELAADVVSKTKIDGSTIKRNSDGQLYVQGSAISISVDELTSSDIDELFTPKYGITFGYLNEGQYASILETAYDANTNVIYDAKAGDTVYAIIWYDNAYYEGGSTVTDASGNTVQFTNTWGYDNPTTGIFAELDLSKIQRANGYAFALKFVMPDSPVTVKFACWYDE